jgi:hypothetical protein
MLAAATVRRATVHPVAAEIAGGADVPEAAVVADVAAADQAADGTGIRRIHRRTQIKKGRNARCGLFFSVGRISAGNR